MSFVTSCLCEKKMRVAITTALPNFENLKNGNRPIVGIYYIVVYTFFFIIIIIVFT